MKKGERALNVVDAPTDSLEDEFREAVRSNWDQKERGKLTEEARAAQLREINSDPKFALLTKEVRFGILREESRAPKR